MTVRPLPALLHPLWLSSLALLLLNDHVLKSSAAHGLVTGKLSDVVGLIVAPTLFALLCGVRTRRGLLRAHLAVGVVFATIQLSPAAAAGWDTMLGLVGVPWHTEPDPTDLVGLVGLALSWRFLRPAMQDRALTRAERATASLGAGVGLVACIATSSVAPPPGPVGAFPDVRAQAWLHNDTDELLTVRIRQLGTEVRLDCTSLLDGDPGAALSEDLFLAATEWDLPARSTVSALENPDLPRTCHAVRVEGDTFAPFVLVWPASDVQTVPGTVLSGGVESSPWGRVALPQIDDRGERLAFPVRDGFCEPQPAIDRLEWWIPTGTSVLEGVEVGPDGCLQVDVSDPADPAWDDRGYVCMPASMWPFVPGDTLDIDADPGVLTVSRADDGSLLTLLAGAEGTLVEGFSLRGSVDEDRCGLAAEPRCGHVSEDAVVEVGPTGRPEEAISLRPGQQKTFFGEVIERVVHVARAEHRVVDDGACDGGLGRTGFELDVIVLRQPLNDDTTPTE